MNNSDIPTPYSALTNDGGGDYSATITGTQLAPGTIAGTFQNDSDPTLNIEDSLNNSTGFAWSQYEVDVLLNNTFSLTSPAVITPASGWNVSSGGTFYNVYSDEYEDVLTFTGAPPIAVSQILDFSYTLSFSATGSFSFDQVFTPTSVPEPTACSLLILGGFGMLARRRSRRIEK
ncbi:MAG: PEP-CTERM sorting domain-containing protein [Tepidisphaeraceae bacterium]